MSDEVENMVYVNLLPWHGKGVRVDKAMTWREAITLGKLDYLVEGKPAYFESSETPGLFKPIPYCIANVRLTDEKVMGVVTDRYKICQNIEAFEFLDGVIDRVDGAHYETAGTLYDEPGADGMGHRKRGRIFLLARMEGVKILGDTVDPYICFTNSFNLETGIQVALTPVRVVCNNTLQMALEGACRVWSTAHTGNLKDKMQEAQETLRNIKKYMEKMPEAAEAMYSTELYEDEIPKILEEIFPLPEMPIDDIPKITIKNIERRRQNVFNIMEQKKDLQRFKGTAWGLYNAISDFSMHFVPYDEAAGYKESVFVRAVQFDPLMNKAQGILQALAKK